MVSRVRVESLTRRSVAREPALGKITDGRDRQNRRRWPGGQPGLCGCVSANCARRRSWLGHLRPTNYSEPPQCGSRWGPQPMAGDSEMVAGSTKIDIGVKLERPSSMPLPADRKPASRALPPGFGVLPAPDEFASRDLRKDL